MESYGGKNVLRWEKQVQRPWCGKELGIQHGGAGRDEMREQLMWALTGHEQECVIILMEWGNPRR